MHILVLTLGIRSLVISIPTLVSYSNLDGIIIMRRICECPQSDVIHGEASAIDEVILSCVVDIAKEMVLKKDVLCCRLLPVALGFRIAAFRMAVLLRWFLV